MTSSTRPAPALERARSTATLVGFTAVLMWSLLALLTSASGRIPPFQLAAMTFLIGGSLGAATWPFRPRARAVLRQDWRVWALGIGGLFGYHFLYFTALRNAPPVEASLVAYLWPLLIVVFSALILGERLRWHHIAGSLLGLAGAALIVTGGRAVALDPAYLVGYLAALACAVTWSLYSVLSRRMAAVPTDVVTGFCLVTAALSLICHLALETTIWPSDAKQWLAVLGLGLMPVGIAFYTWDYGVKRGDIQILGAASYAAPLLSTMILLVAGVAEPRWSIMLAAILITVGAVIAARDMIFPRSG